MLAPKYSIAKDLSVSCHRAFKTGMAFVGDLFEGSPTPASDAEVQTAYSKLKKRYDRLLEVLQVRDGGGTAGRCCCHGFRDLPPFPLQQASLDHNSLLKQEVNSLKQTLEECLTRKENETAQTLRDLSTGFLEQRVVTVGPGFPEAQLFKIMCANAMPYTHPARVLQLETQLVTAMSHQREDAVKVRALHPALLAPLAGLRETQSVVGNSAG